MTDSLKIKQRLQKCKSKEETFKTLVILSKTLERLSDPDKSDENKIKGCESAVWLLEYKEGELSHFKADSDAKLMRGVLVAILELVNGKSKAQIRAMDLKTELAELNLSSYLTTSRTNGVLAILSFIQAHRTH
ncbi:SufE family protein [Marinomonas sp.]